MTTSAALTRALFFRSAHRWTLILSPGFSWLGLDRTVVVMGGTLV